MKHIGIVLAAGSGKRMNSDIPKQYLELEGKPVLYYSLKAMQDSFMDEIILVTASDYIEYCKEEIVEKYSLTKVVKIISGGAERSDSVYAGISEIEDESSYVYIHDGARPFVNGDILNRAREDVIKYDACVVCVESKDTVKISDGEGFVKETPVRKNVYNIQTPQAFRLGVLKEAFKNMKAAQNPMVTDDAMVVEAFSDTKVRLTRGEYFNIKITTSEDLEVGKNFLKNF